MEPWFVAALRRPRLDRLAAFCCRPKTQAADVAVSASGTPVYETPYPPPPAAGADVRDATNPSAAAPPAAKRTKSGPAYAAPFGPGDAPWERRYATTSGMNRCSPGCSVSVTKPVEFPRGLARDSMKFSVAVAGEVPGFASTSSVEKAPVSTIEATTWTEAGRTARTAARNAPSFVTLSFATPYA